MMAALSNEWLDVAGSASLTFIHAIAKAGHNHGAGARPLCADYFRTEPYPGAMLHIRTERASYNALNQWLTMTRSKGFRNGMRPARSAKHFVTAEAAVETASLDPQELHSDAHLTLLPK